MRHTLYFAALLAISACAGQHSSAPVVDRYNPAEKPPPYYVVTTGDTLFSISWRYGFDLERLANANSIAKPYTIYPGQQLVLQESSSTSARPVKQVKPQTSKPLVTAPTLPAPKPATPISPPPKAAVVTAPKVEKPKPPVVAKVPVDSGAWRWPHQGRLVRRFVATGQAHKGIDIKGKMGEPVRASKSGTVVYAGSGLVGYGNLLILKHSGNYLSAYGHNRRLMKKEGDTVNAGEVIAELGDSGTDSAKLHFEVRKDGKPIDPLNLLPRR